MGKLISFIFLIFFLSCGGGKETIKETVVQLPEAYIKQLEELKAQISSMSSQLAASSTFSEAEKNALKNQIEALQKQQTVLEKQLESLKSELPIPETPKLNLTSNEQKVLDWLKDKMRYGKIQLLVNKKIEPNYGYTSYDTLEFMDNYLFRILNEGVFSYGGGYNNQTFLDFNFLFNEIGYKKEGGKIIYCGYNNYYPTLTSCPSDPPPDHECLKPIIQECKMFSAGCNLNVIDTKCFQNIVIGEENILQFDLVPNYKAKLCEAVWVMKRWIDPNNPEYKYPYNPTRNETCSTFGKLPNDIPFKLTFIVKKDGSYEIKDQNEYFFVDIKVMQFFPEKQH